MLENVIFSLIAVLIFVFLFSMFYIISRIENRRSSEEKGNLMKEALKDKHLDIEVSVASGEWEFYLMFFVGVFIFFLLFVSLVKSIIDWDENSMNLVSVSPYLLMIPTIFMLFFWPFARTGRLIISRKLVFLPEWTLRILKMKPTIFRVENVDYVKVHYRRFGKKKIERLTFETSVWGSLRLSRKDYSKYAQVLEYLRSMGIEVRQ